MSVRFRLPKIELRRSFVWKLVLPIPVAIVIAVAAVWFIVPGLVSKNVEETAIANAVQTVEHFRTFRGYYARQVVTKAIATGGLKPSVDHKDKPNGIPVPATLIHDLSALSKKNDVSLTFVSPFPFKNREGRKMDGFQQEAWATLSGSETSVFARREMRGGKEVLRIAVADRFRQQGCVDCHNAHPGSPKKDWKLGDLRGLLQVTTVIDKPLAAGARLSNNIVLGLLFAGIALLLAVLFAANRISNPVRHLTEVMRGLSEGDADTEVPESKRDDEIGEMARTLGVFRDNLKEVTRLREADIRHKLDRETLLRERLTALALRLDEEVKPIVGDVDARAKKMRASAAEMNDVSVRLHEKTDSVTQGAAQATGNVEAVAVAASQMSGAIEGIGAQVNNSTEIAKRAVEEVQRTNNTVTGLSDAALKIGEVVNLISEIAEQTNLLALNATIEAARAGDAGKGFAVVASEVKNLASQTARATEEIASHVGSIQSVSEDAVGAISGIGSVIDEVSKITVEIAEAIAEQGQATENITSHVSEAAGRTRQVTGDIGRVGEDSDKVNSLSASVLGNAAETSDCINDLYSRLTAILEEMARSNASDDADIARQAGTLKLKSPQTATV